MNAFAYGLAAIAVIMLGAWLASIWKRDVSIVDTLWSLLFLAAALVYFALQPQPGARAYLALSLVAIWALRLSVHIGWRNRGSGEDRRYRAIRVNNEPRFWLKSLYIVFALQGALAAIISLPLLIAIQGQAELGPLDMIAVALWMIGITFETVGDLQLAAFKRSKENQGKVMDRGLWRYTRHPNYFGDCCVWWAFYLLALSAGGWWTIISPVLMTWLLLKVSGVSLLEHDIGERRPAYADYKRRTSSFIPWPPRRMIDSGTRNASAE